MIDGANTNSKRKLQALKVDALVRDFPVNSEVGLRLAVLGGKLVDLNAAKILWLLIRGRGVLGNDRRGDQDEHQEAERIEPRTQAMK